MPEYRVIIGPANYTNYVTANTPEEATAKVTPGLPPGTPDEERSADRWKIVSVEEYSGGRKRANS